MVLVGPVERRREELDPASAPGPWRLERRGPRAPADPAASADHAVKMVELYSVDLDSAAAAATTALDSGQLRPADLLVAGDVSPRGQGLVRGS